ncbi:MAG TPA: DNA translocase FtsK 4TM domain-containing protein, partial [Abditibacterium sp.]
MSRFPAPLDDFEMDDLDFPTFETPQRRASRPAAPRPQTSRPQTSRPQTSRRAASMPPLAPPVEDVFEDLGRAAPRPQARKRPATSNRSSAANRPTTASTPAPPRSISSRKVRGVHFQIAGVLLLALGGLLAYNAFQTTHDGLLPRLAVQGLRFSFGIGAVFLPSLLMILGLMLFIKRQNVNLGAFWRGAGCAFLTLVTAAHLRVPRGLEFFDAQTLHSHGGYVGGALSWVLRRGLGEVGAWVALGALLLVALLLGTENTLGELSRALSAKFGAWKQKISHKTDDLRAHLQQKRDEKDAARDSHRASNHANWDEEETDDFDESGDFEVEEQPASRTLPPEIARDAKAKRPSPFMAVEDVIGSESAPKNTPKTAPKSLEEFPNVPSAAIDPDSSLEDPQFVKPKADAVRIEILDAPPPPSVVDSVVDLAPLGAVEVRAVLTGENSDEELTPIESLEKQAEESATEGEVVKAPKTELPRRSFGDGPLMPTYFDPAVRALDPPVPPDNAGAEEEIQKGVA